MQENKIVWERICNSDQEAYAEAYRFYYKKFYNYGRKFSDNEFLVEDAVQEVLILLWDKRTELADITYPATYFYTAFRHLLFDKLKRENKTSINSAIEAEPDFSVDHFIIATETDADRQEQLKKAIATLTPRQREAIFLRFYEGLSYDDVASVLGITTKATYKIMARALQQLKENISLPALLFFFFSLSSANNSLQFFFKRVG